MSGEADSRGAGSVEREAAGARSSPSFASSSSASSSGAGAAGKGESRKTLHASRSALHALVIALALVLSGRAGFAQTAVEPVREIKPPFGLSWGETDERIEKLLKGAKATIVERRTLDDGRAAWTVEGLVQTGLRRTLFYFRRGELVEVELQYQKDDWDQPKYDAFMGDVRRRIEQRYGVGQQIARKTEPEGDVMQTVVGYKWNLNSTAIELVYYSAQQSANVFRTLSVHYKVY